MRMSLFFFFTKFKILPPNKYSPSILHSYFIIVNNGNSVHY
ncbi:RNA-metabolising metallo-beta-lactamase [Staphylococcus pseudintermedius]|nr:RNA-metabolising metallo-beta-lactamase [Staphylococcus pseudintermedius]EGQ2963127.1 RNA-metabolising metallo-beta-lactamase [Staphylococcus pseudintermedius]